MPSIFVWKSETPITSNKQIRHYYGSNWFMEDNEYASKSYKYLEQTLITTLNNEKIIVYNAKTMPQDWVGSELLEVSSLPYKMIKSDNYGTLEQIGIWMRFISNNDIEFDNIILTKEVDKINSWKNLSSQMSKDNKNNNTYSLHKYRNNNIKYYNNNKLNNYNNKLNNSIENIQLNFQEFLIKYSMPSMINNTTNI
jgi:hypothetical protein